MLQRRSKRERFDTNKKQNKRDTILKNVEKTTTKDCTAHVGLDHCYWNSEGTPTVAQEVTISDRCSEPSWSQGRRIVQVQYYSQCTIS